ncbi:hypothetical protein LN244_01770 [Marinobacterium sediminicola]|nr:hypothetical protein LN244_01770 [Marinobacterium sediminicola]
MAVNMDLTADGSNNQVDGGDSFPGWFTEGAAEFIHGADERVQSDIARVGIAAILAAHQTTPGSPTTSEGYSAAYIAVKKLHADIQSASGGAAGIKDVMAHLAADRNNSLDSALASLKGSYATLPYGSLSEFDTHFASNGADFINGLGLYATNGLNLADDDTGSIAGSDYGGSVLNAENVLANDVRAGSAQNFSLNSPTLAPDKVYTFVIGTHASDKIELATSGVDTVSLGISLVDIAVDASGASDKFDKALDVNTKHLVHAASVFETPAVDFRYCHEGAVYCSG